MPHLHPEPLLPRPGGCPALTPPDQRHHAAPDTTDQQLRERIGEKLLQLRREEAVVLSESPRLCLVCDEQVEQHAALRKGNIQSASSGCGRCWGVPGCWGEASGCSLQAQREEVELPHSQERGLHVQGEEELQTLQENYKSVYLHPATYAFALLSAGSLLRVRGGERSTINACRARAGVGIIRPPATTPSWTAPMASASTTTWSSPPTGWDAKGAGGGLGCAPRQRHPARVCGRAEGAVRVPPPPRPRPLLPIL
ncbi:uncharacterized protein LOC126989762 [Eriocheir sinensis]|uniref:uncharacterized protein LOC126989762 n=1 Tax=Eriocheir sinensis TaxID=95602 RepID=UPI0021C847E6|nr:uncharacterized protein LOC126989762 [Eriocheir sinensis]